MHDHDFRRRYSPDLTTLIKDCEVGVHLLTDPKEAKYQYTYDFRAVDGEPQSEWFHIVPSAPEKVTFISASDGNGGLQTTVEKQGESQTKITVRFRKSIGVGEEYKFTFSYQARLISLSFFSFLSRSVVYTDSVYLLNPCERLRIKITLPDNGVPIKSTPEADLNSNPITHEFKGVQPLDDFTFLLAYRQRRVGKQFWITAASITASVILGALFRQFIF